MLRYFFFSLLCLFCLITDTVIFGQNVAQKSDKYTLLTMPYNKRPLTLYKRQLQVNAGYKFAVRTNSFNSDGDNISLKEDGSASVFHNYFIELRYGIADFIEVKLETGYLKKGIRSESASYLISSSEIISVNTLTETKGMSDISVKASFRLPFEYNKYDVRLIGGISLPTAEYETQKPEHTIENYTSATNFSLNYHYINKNGFGVPVYYLGFAGKFGLEKVSVEIDVMYETPAKEGSNIRWSQSLINSTFTYYSESYNYLLNNNLAFNASLHYQATGWFNVFINGNYYKSSGGWAEYAGSKYANNKANLLNLEPGFEIQISPSLTIYQSAGFPLSGKNIDAPFYILTTASFNLFPFVK